MCARARVRTYVYMYILGVRMRLYGRIQNLINRIKSNEIRGMYASTREKEINVDYIHFRFFTLSLKITLVEAIGISHIL